MNSYSIRFIHWLFRVGNDTVKHRNSWDIYFKGYITNNFPITILFLLRLLLYCSPTFFLKRIARCKPGTYTDRGRRNRMLLPEPPVSFPACPHGQQMCATGRRFSWAGLEGTVLSGMGHTDASRELLPKVRSICGWLETISIWVCAQRYIYFRVCVLTDMYTHVGLTYFCLEYPRQGKVCTAHKGKSPKHQ